MVFCPRYFNLPPGLNFFPTESSLLVKQLGTNALSLGATQKLLDRRQCYLGDIEKKEAVLSFKSLPLTSTFVLLGQGNYGNHHGGQ